ncbi:alpha/beta fold hydrolase [Tenacibaculum tangerinum]|uniref:Alpha/beta fold hydrolase n=1 Tax=Tenacibaculum tangerinum TaxID=3038772 RepID=A0ABY8KZF4_9FLAO|nr:alpha/beta fold hydrolase [Tenacibaculum tangerinum]WGH74391.1 alpha/beta fold hydrolase [Tenacibaculum tangerinum]
MKKNILFLFIFLISLIAQAQLTNGNFTTEIDERFKNLNKTTITSNILIDRVFSMAEIQTFNQNLRKDTSNVSHFKQAWSELYRASYTKNFPSVDIFKNQLKAKKYTSNVVPIGIINTAFHECNFGTTEQNATVSYNSSTGLFSNIAGKIPFIKKQTTIIAPLVTKASGHSITFTTDNLFKLYKQGKPIKNLILYTNNSSFSLISNYNLRTTNFSTTYQNTGLQTLRFVVTYSDNTSKTTYGTVNIIKPVTYAQRDSSSNLLTIDSDDDLLFQGYDENQVYRGLNEYRIYYDTQNNDEVVNKPLYIIDGYDPNDSRKIDAQDYINFNPNEDKSIIDLMKYGNNINLIDSLNHKGFDVIIVNHPVYNRGNKTIDGGSDYIERNAYTFISLIRHIKSIQQGNEKAVVIGPSMGGLISRYALAFMEKKLAETGDNTKWNHNTRLWVSFDSPHQGANIPIGVQKGIQYFAEVLDNEGAKEFINEELNKPAPKQMLVNHYTNNTSLPVGAPNFRNRFQNALDNIGMPQNLRKVALLNGSIYGQLNGVSSGNYLDIDTKIPILFGLFHFNLLHSDFYHSTNIKSGSQKFLTFSNDGFYISFLFWKITIIKGRHTYSSPSSKGSYDIAPGGHFGAHKILAKESNSDSYWSAWGIRWVHTLTTRSTIFDPTHSFIPTKSALAYTGSSTLDEYLADKNRVCTGETPFDGYFAPQNNEEHIFLTNENVNWLTEEIMGNPQNPPVYIRPFTIQGENTICYSEYKTFTIDAISSCQSTTQWSVSNNLIISSQTNKSITVTPIDSSTNGLGWISAKREGGNTVIDDKGIWVGKPLEQFASFRLVGNTQIFSQQWSRLEASGQFLIPEYEKDLYTFDYDWSIPNSEIRYAENKRIANIKPYYTGNINIGLRLKNICGCSNWYTRQFNVVYEGGGTGGGGNVLTPVFE